METKESKKLYNILENLSTSNIYEFEKLVKSNQKSGNLSDKLASEAYITIDKIMKDISDSAKIKISNNCIIIENILPITEGMVANSKNITNVNNKINFMIGCYDDDKRSYSKETAYFKFLDGYSWDKAKRLARITIYNPTYIIHKSNDGKEQWILNSKERKLLDNIMHSRTKDGISVWHNVCEEFNSVAKLSINFGNEIPNFNTINKE